jgi:hypothetical protein
LECDEELWDFLPFSELGVGAGVESLIMAMTSRIIAERRNTGPALVEIISKLSL